MERLWEHRAEKAGASLVSRHCSLWPATFPFQLTFFFASIFLGPWGYNIISPRLTIKIHLWWSWDGGGILAPGRKEAELVEGNEFHFYLPPDSCVSYRSVNSSSSYSASCHPEAPSWLFRIPSVIKCSGGKVKVLCVCVCEGGGERRLSRCFREADSVTFTRWQVVKLVWLLQKELALHFCTRFYWYQVSCISASSGSCYLCSERKVYGSSKLQTVLSVLSSEPYYRGKKALNNSSMCVYKGGECILSGRGF